MIDSHHHIWRMRDLPWLSGPEQPRIFGGYASVRRDYLIGEFRSDAEPSGITHSVYVQANWPPGRGTDEAKWVQAVADRNGWPHAIVAFADVVSADPRPQLDALAAAAPLLRGIRQQFHWHSHAQYRFAERPDLCSDRQVQRNIARLAAYGLVFDLQVFAPQMAGAAALAEACPDVTFVLQHAGMLEDPTSHGRREWETGMRRLSECGNVSVKLSGLGTFLRRNDPGHIRDTVHTTVGLFGAGRCMFGSNFPIEKIWTGYASMADAYFEACSGFTEAERDAIFRTAAARVYGIAAQ